jgi:hypothetical protein
MRQFNDDTDPAALVKIEKGQDAGQTDLSSFGSHGGRSPRRSAPTIRTGGGTLLGRFVRTPGGEVPGVGQHRRCG